ncbi:MAG: aminotransferase class III-fold pyridoxal phosphate-dependent enzyme [Proteobacteria bacterium]|nr:aminotransferase class III-fold pyridoxal phosphate-dependent enzyme [Pseudomonadota bacterium]
MDSREIVELTAKHTYGTWRFQKGWKPLHVVDANGCFFKDSDGNEYLDFSSQLMCSTLGHKNQAVIDAIAEQARQLAYIGPGFATTARAELTKLLLEVLPKGLTKFFFTTSGTEANEAAFKVARLYTGKHKIIARYKSYHGSTAGSIAATGDLRRWPIEPSGKIDGVVFGPECDCYRCPIGRHYPECATACADYIEHMIVNESNVAAVIIEPIVGTNGILVPPDEYMPKLFLLARKHGVLVIADEVMTGWGRTGSWFAVDHWKQTPDILCTAKGITAAMVPLGLTATSQAIADYFDTHYFPLGHTYEAHPLTLWPAVATINELKSKKLVERAATLESYLGSRLKALADKHPSVGDVRGKGLFWAVELVKDRKTKEPFSVQRDKLEGKPMLIDKVCAELMKQGVFVVGWISHLVIAPPLIVSEAELDRGVAAIDKALAIADAEVKTN